MAELHAPEAKSPDALRDLTGTTVGRFAIRARLGAGGMGEVYRAEDTKLKRTVALKRMAPRLQADEHFRRRFLREAERASRLADQHIAGLYDILEENNEIFLVMEHVEGQTLRRRLGQPLSLDDFLPLAHQCAEALVAAHEKGIIHRDIKPENIMLTPAGQVKILDFGVARVLPHADVDAVTGSTDSLTGSLSGTPAYMAPEELLQKDADGRADLFSLGVVFYEALTGRHPFRSDTFMATADRILHEPPLPPSQLNPQVPAELDRLILILLAKNPADRYPSARDLLAALSRFGRPEARTETLPARPQLLARRVGLRLAAVLAVTLALVLVASPTIRHALVAMLSGGLPAEKHLAVLPFVNVGGDPANQAFCDGLTYTLTSRLSQLEQFQGSLLVVPASEVFRSDVRSAEEARKQFGVSLVLTGSVQRAGDKVMLNINLVDTHTLRQLRSQTLEAGADDLWLLQTGVPRDVAALLEVELAPEAETALAFGRTDVPQAYSAYLQGRGYLQRYEKPENIDLAIGEFRRALELDSNYALAYAGLGEAYWKKYEATQDQQWVDTARRSCERALSLDAQLPAPHVCLGTLHAGTGEYEKAVAEFGRALALDPRSADAHRGLAAAQERQGKLADAEQTYRRAIELRPTDWAGYNWLGVFYYRQGRYEEAAKMFEQVVALTPDNARGYSNLGGIYHLLGRADQALAAFRKSLAISPTASAHSNIGTVEFFRQHYTESARAFEKATQLAPGSSLYWGNLGDAYTFAPGESGKAAAAYQRAISLVEGDLRVNPRDATALAWLAHYRAKSGQTAEALAAIRRAEALAPEDVNVIYRAAVVYQHVGQTDLALARLRRAVEHGYSLAEIGSDPEWQALRRLPEFQRLITP